jgi:hypothetical protein
MSTINPFAPQALNGVNALPDGDYVDVDFTYVYDVALLAGEVRRDQTVPLNNDADFVWRAVHFTKPDPVAVGIFRVRFSDSQGYYHSNALILEGNYSAQPQSPTPIMPELVFPRGGAIGLDIQNTDLAVACTVQICFRGVKRYRVAK